MFEITGSTTKMSVDMTDVQDKEKKWVNLFLEEAAARKASLSTKKAIEGAALEELVREVYKEFSEKAMLQDGVTLPEDVVLTAIGELSGLGQIMPLFARPDIEDIAINIGHIYAFTTGQGWWYHGPTDDKLAMALRVLMERANQRTPTPEMPIADATIQVAVPTLDGGVRRKGVRINYMIPPASPYGVTITLRVSTYKSKQDGAQGLAVLCNRRLPPVKKTDFQPVDFARGQGVLSPEAANYLLSVMVHGGTLIISGATGSGKTFIAQRILQETLNFFPSGALRLFIIEDSNEIVLNGWNGSPQEDTGNIVYTVTRPEIPGGARPVTMYDLVRAALRSRPHGLIIGEARGPEAWELVRAAATGHGHSIFTIHATGADHVWPRFLQVARSHPDAQGMDDFQIAQSFAEAVTTIVHVERGMHGQVVREIAEVQLVVEKAAARPSVTPLFKSTDGILVSTGNVPNRKGFRAENLNLAVSMFRNAG
jgi:Flp pilus assembly CpaF family ATPase